MLFVVRPQKVRSEVDLPVWGHPQEPITLRLHPHPEKQANNNSTKLWVRSRDGSVGSKSLASCLVLDFDI